MRKSRRQQRTERRITEETRSPRLEERSDSNKNRLKEVYINPWVSPTPLPKCRLNDKGADNGIFRFHNFLLFFF